MVVILHDIVPDGDLELVLRDHSTKIVTPVVVLPYFVDESMCHDQVDEDKVDCPKVSAADLPSLLPSGTDNEPTEIRMRISCRHLALASPMFNKMTSGPWKEASLPTSQPDLTLPDAPEIPGPSSVPTFISSLTWSPVVREVTTTGWNAHALVVVLNIIHGRHRDVPRNISLEFFADVAIIVDYYQCEKAVQLAADLWHNLIYKTPERYGKAAFMWLYISWVFSWPQVFSEMLRMIAMDGTGIVDTKDLPVGQLLVQLDTKRQKFLGDIVKRLDRHIDHLRLGFEDTGCPIRCRFMKLGILVSEQSKMEDLEPPLDYSNTLFTGYSITSIIEMVKKFPTVEFYDTIHGRAAQTPHRCSTTNYLLPTIGRMLRSIDLLSITDYQR
ncbi:hypothetical protein ACHAP5_007329 [Fusarium lateritium]